jgi:hypothetical protein
VSRELKARHPQAHQHLGLSLADMIKRSATGSWRLLRFLYGLRFLELHDRRVGALCMLMMAWVPGGIAWMFGPVIGLFEVR